jgi:hypothetical protein
LVKIGYNKLEGFYGKYNRGIYMYKYRYEESVGDSIFSLSNHREIIDRVASEGWRFVAAIPGYQTTNGKAKTFDLVFEKEDNWQ